MTNIYLEFTNGQTTIRKQRETAKYLGITTYQLVKLIAGRKYGSFEHEGITWNFKTVNANLLPKDKKSELEKETPTYSKIFGSVEVVYSSYTDRMLFSRSVKNNSQNVL